MPTKAQLLRAAGGAGLCALAALIVHQIAYLIVFGVGVLTPGEMTDHGHLAAQWAIVSPIAVLSASAFVLRQVKRLGVQNPLPILRTALIAGLFFFAQEMVEGFLAGRGALDVVTAPAVIVGLLLAPLVAFALSRVLGGVAELVRRFIRRPQKPTPGSTVFPPVRSRIAIPVRVTSNAPPRGPPGRRSPRR